MRILGRVKNQNNIYQDTQNVHNHHIQESIKNSVNNLLDIKPTIENFEKLTNLIVNDNILSDTTKRLLLEYANLKDIYIALNITFEELLLCVFDRIERNDFKDEIKKVLNTEIEDPICKCFTGRISRLVNCLNGFDPLININISDTDQISEIIIQTKSKLEKENNYTVDLHKNLTKQRLIELNYDIAIINSWIDYIE